jgi:hypothetical protein
MHGYARVSTDGQSVKAQVAALTAAGAVTVYREVASGAQTDRAELRQVLARLAAGDVLMVTRLYRQKSPQSTLQGDGIGLSHVPPVDTSQCFRHKDAIGVFTRVGKRGTICKPKTGIQGTLRQKKNP